MQERASAPAPSADPPAATLADGVRRTAAAHPSRPALVSGDQTVTWAELDTSIDAVANALLGLVPPPTGGYPARVAIALANSPEFAVAFFAAQRAGLVAVPVNPAFTAPELRHVLADSAAAVLICTERVRELVAGVGADLPALTSVHTDLPTAPGGPPLAAVPAADDLAVLLYTSGTEGRPKGAMLSHRALLANHEQIGRINPPVVGPDDTALLALPLFHAYGLNAGLGAVAYHGACGVLVDRFDPADTLESVIRHRVTVVIGVPSMFLAWSLLSDRAAAGVGVSPEGGASSEGGVSPETTGPAATSAVVDLGAALASVRVAVCGAAPLAAQTAARFTEATRRPVFVGYGLTETAPVLTSTLASTAAKVGSIGAPIPGVELRLVAASGEDLWRDGSAELDDEDELDIEFSSPGTDPGEIVVRGANLFSGYWPDGRDGPDADGWWATGDIAYADADGDLFLVDRVGELILVNGFNVYPYEVELVLGAHPAVAESAVLGVPHPDTGQTVKAYAVRAPDRTVTAEELLAHCERNLARFKCPTEVEFVETLPHSAIGKVRKTLLRPEPPSRRAVLPKARAPHGE